MVTVGGLVDTIIIKNQQHDYLLKDYFISHTTASWLCFKCKTMIRHLKTGSFKSQCTTQMAKEFKLLLTIYIYIYKILGH